jgi:hypothetical protein
VVSSFTLGGSKLGPCYTVFRLARSSFTRFTAIFAGCGQHLYQRVQCIWSMSSIKVLLEQKLFRINVVTCFLKPTFFPPSAMCGCVPCCCQVVHACRHGMLVIGHLEKGRKPGSAASKEEGGRRGEWRRGGALRDHRCRCRVPPSSRGGVKAARCPVGGVCRTSSLLSQLSE